MISELFHLLTNDELHELDQFLLFDLDSDEGMTLDILDGYLHAIAVGPTTVLPQQWLPKVWGLDGFLPPTESLNEANHVVGLVMRHYNGILGGLQKSPREISPVWMEQEYRGKIYDQGEGWAFGFMEGMRLCWDDWTPMLESAEGKIWFRPIGLLAEDGFSPDQDELTRTPARRAKLTHQIPNAVLAMHAYWLPYRHAVHEREMAKAMQAKVGRNEACPCGSGKKFKKCCGAAGLVH